MTIPTAIGNLLPAATVAAPLGGSPSLPWLIVLAMAPGMVMLVILIRAILKASGVEDNAGNAIDPRIQSEGCMRDCIEQLNGNAQRIYGVVDAIQLSPTDIVPAAASEHRIRDDFTLGLITVDSRPVTLLDIKRGFSAHELSVLRSIIRTRIPEYAPA